MGVHRFSRLAPTAMVGDIPRFLAAREEIDAAATKDCTYRPPPGELCGVSESAEGSSRALLNTEIAHCSVRRTDGSRGGAKARPCSSHVLVSPEAVGLPLLGLILIYVY